MSTSNFVYIRGDMANPMTNLTRDQPVTTSHGPGVVLRVDEGKPCHVTPYYEDERTTIYCGDSREILPLLEVDAIVTDPVWPNAVVPLYGHENPGAMLLEVLTAAGESVKRLAVQLGCDSDPRFLQSVPSRWPFFRVCWLDMSKPHYKGRLLAGAEIGYLFGEVPVARPGAHVIPGMCRCHSSQGKQADHPCPRKIAHVSWLVNWWTEIGDVVCDPFMGSGTTALAARFNGRKFVGIEVEEKYCETAVKRLAQQGLGI